LRAETKLMSEKSADLQATFFQWKKAACLPARRPVPIESNQLTCAEKLKRPGLCARLVPITEVFEHRESHGSEHHDAHDHQRRP
jgi:hypothetical protein